ncbi:hypothetical protein ACGLQ7_001704 [Escherichia albertii]|uniref:hypothetical protein n=1 Tax=Escherichia albertii TaxID=208962 RepID=UPI00211A8E83|nr:hypothetical protein [Escherichia albertii]MCQ8934092.1 hypothetical protein [Escherichia albertii]UUL05343.1 hypothetical protein NIZ17_22105 [Escherichia albertii]HEB1565477.1 hypothetical protein [Escherichia albertii]HEB1607755.1 hypothetical protein [Escherichia albertii]
MDFATITSSVVLSACVAGLASLINGAWQRKSERKIEVEHRAAETRAKIREMALPLALKEWESHQTVSKAKGGTVSGPEVYVFRYFRMLNLMENDRFMIENLRRTQYDAMCAVTVIQAEIERYREKNGLLMP